MWLGVGALGVVIAGTAIVFSVASGSPDPTASGEPTASPSASASVSPAPQNLKPGAVLVLATNQGEITMALDVAAAPQATNAIAYLASTGFYAGNKCHRLTTKGIFVLQCGSANGDGTGDVGFTVPDENLPEQGSNDYLEGTVAMANAGPGTSSSQFFIVYKNTTLPPSYSIFGKVTSGLDVVQKVAAGGVRGGSGDGPPAIGTVIESATVENP